jgi:MFS family permease
MKTKLLSAVVPESNSSADLSLPLLGVASARSDHNGGGSATCADWQPLPPAGCYMRHTMCGMTLLMVTCAYYQRTNLSVAILDMSMELGYTSSDSGLLLSSFFIGYIFSQLPGGHLAAKIGAKPIIGASILLSGLISATTPFAARSSFAALVFLRISLGVVQGILYPSIMTLWSVWAPPMERSKLCSTCLAGAVLGTLLSMPISSLLCTSPLGWPLAFYFSGAFACTCSLLWTIVADSSPASSRWAKPAEVEYIASAIAAGSYDDRATDNLPTTTITTSSSSSSSSFIDPKPAFIGPYTSMLHVPWTTVITHPCILALFVAHFANGWG